MLSIDFPFLKSLYYINLVEINLQTNCQNYEAIAFVGDRIQKVFSYFRKNLLHTFRKHNTKDFCMKTCEV